MKAKKLILLLLLMPIEHVTAQDFNSIMERVNNQYLNADNYAINVVYTLYTDASKEKPREIQKGVIYKYKENYCFGLGDSEVIMASDFCIKINHSQKVLLYSKLKESPYNMFKEQNPFLGLVDKFETKEALDKESYWECILSNALSNLLPYQKITIQVSKKNYRIIKQTYIFNKSMEKLYTEGINSTGNDKLEILYSAYDEFPKAKKNLFNLEVYLNIVGNNYTLSNSFKDYQIVLQ